MISQVSEKFRLLSGDALIVTTCLEHNISTLATFDYDFKGVEGLNFYFYEVIYRIPNLAKIIDLRVSVRT